MHLVDRQCLGKRGETCFKGVRTGVLYPSVSTMETLVTGQLDLWPPSPHFNSHTNSVFLHSCQRTFSQTATDTFRVYEFDFSLKFVFKFPYADPQNEMKSHLSRPDSWMLIDQL